VTTFPLIDHQAAGRVTPRRLPRGLSRFATWLRVAACHDVLDAELARGTDPRSRPGLALRADQLERMRHRRALAASLRRVHTEAMAPPASPRSQPVPIERAQVRADAADLVALADRLAFPQPAANVAGIAIARQLVTDGLASPLYSAREPHTLRRLARRALAELGPMD
jgi:hypothetical protein